MSASQSIKQELWMKKQISRVSLTKRLVAFMIDWYVSGVLISLPVLAIMQTQGKGTVLELRNLPFSSACLAFIGAFLVFLIYFIWVPFRTNGQTLGKKMLGLQIVEESQRHISCFALVKRHVLGIMLIEGGLISITPLLWQVVFYQHADLQLTLTSFYYGLSIVSAIMIVISKKGKALHDALANTKVIQKEK